MHLHIHVQLFLYFKRFRSLYCYFPTDLWYIWVNQMSGRASMRCISLLVWKRFLSAVIFSLLCDTPLMSRGEIRTEVTFCSWKMFSVFSSRTLEQNRCSLLSRFEWSFCVKWKDVWRLVCRVSFTTLEFFFLFGKRFLNPPLCQRYMSVRWEDKYGESAREPLLIH